MKRVIVMLVSLMWVAAGLTLAQEPSVKAAPSVKSMPPSIVKTVPMSGDEAVDSATTTQIKATFSKVMKDGNWAQPSFLIGFAGGVWKTRLAFVPGQ